MLAAKGALVEKFEYILGLQIRILLTVLQVILLKILMLLKM